MRAAWRWTLLGLAGAALLAGLVATDTSPVQAAQEETQQAEDQDRRFDNGYCLGCHDAETSGISLANPELPSGEVLDITVHRDTYGFSVHGRLDMSGGTSATPTSPNIPTNPLRPTTSVSTS